MYLKMADPLAYCAEDTCYLMTAVLHSLARYC